MFLCRARSDLFSAVRYRLCFSAGRDHRAGDFPQARRARRSVPPSTLREAAAVRVRENLQDYNYEKHEVLGDSSYGVVMRVRDRRTGEEAAVKNICHHGEAATTDLPAVFREARCLAACGGHPSVVEMKELVTDGVSGQVFIVMEFVGPSLRSLITRSFSEAQARGCMRQLMHRAERMHGAGIIHRDIKPGNILVGGGGAIKICDLGTATPVNPAGLPYPEDILCTLWYRVLELLIGSWTYGPAVDIWSRGCVMAELLAGEPLFEDEEDDVGVIARVLSLQMEMTSREYQAFEDLPGLSEAGRELLCGLLSVEPEDRLTATEALSHRWLAEEDAPMPSVLASPIQTRDFISFL